jgi:hypothetical protein
MASALFRIIAESQGVVNKAAIQYGTTEEKAFA